MSQKRRASKLEQIILETEQAAFLAWKETLSSEQYQALFEVLCTRLARLGYLAPPPAGLWSLPEEEREPYSPGLPRLMGLRDVGDGLPHGTGALAGDYRLAGAGEPKSGRN